jgi:GrpB-like predicted nucleotidyltransferase (UPF0157 family)
MMKFIEPHREEWKVEFENLKSVLYSLLESYEVDIQHVGSTAIPNVFAKPILDIDIILDDKSLLDGISERLEKNGYTNKGDKGISGRFAFRQNSEWTPKTNNHKKWQEHHLYVCYSDSLALKNHLLLRDALLNDKRLAEQYSMLKFNLANQEGMTREKYTKQKTDFIITVLTTLGFDNNELIEIKRANV